MANLNEIALLVVVMTAFFLLLIIYIVIEKITAIRKKSKHILEMAQLKQTYDQELLNSQLEIQEQTFQSISQEIHDNIGQVLSLAKLNMGIINQQNLAGGMVEDTRNLITKAINDLRDLSKSLSPERVSEIDLAESIALELQRLEKTGIYHTHLQANGVAYALPKEKKIILFRIFQEVMNNMVKHSDATMLNVIMQFDPNHFSLTISDNGKGFDTDNILISATGLGLRNIQNRSSLIGGNAQIISQLGQGTRIVLSLPINTQ